jgi:hypothetical protein
VSTGICHRRRAAAVLAPLSFAAVSVVDAASAHAAQPSQFGLEDQETFTVDLFEGEATCTLTGSLHRWEDPDPRASAVVNVEGDDACATAIDLSVSVQYETEGGDELWSSSTSSGRATSVFVRPVKTVIQAQYRVSYQACDPESGDQCAWDFTILAPK